MFSPGIQMTQTPNTKMPNLRDRRRLKDRIVENISKAVKQIQHYQMCCGEDAVLDNTDRRFHKLVENLDHALLHGLRHITNGYWVVVKEFTHNSVVRQINLLTKVTTNLGRGRAWLYLALADHLLESYLRCLGAEKHLVRKHYVKEALVADHQQMELLLMLSAGLEHVQFQLELDVPYLDLASHIRVNPTQIMEEGEEGERQGGGGGDTDETISLCSMDSSQSMSSSISRDYENTSIANLGDFYNHQMSPLSPDVNPKRLVRNCHSLPTIDPHHTKLFQDGATVALSTSHQRNSLDLDHRELSADDHDLEVIHVKVKGHRSKKKKLHKKQMGEPAEKSADLVGKVPDPLTPESGYRSATDRLSLREGDTGDCVLPRLCSEMENSTMHEASPRCVTENSTDTHSVSAGQKSSGTDTPNSFSSIAKDSELPVKQTETTDICENNSRANTTPSLRFTQSFNKSIDWVEGRSPESKDKVSTTMKSLACSASSPNDSGFWKDGEREEDLPRSNESSIYDASPEREIRGVADGAETPSSSTSLPSSTKLGTTGAKHSTNNDIQIPDLVHNRAASLDLDLVGNKAVGGLLSDGLAGIKKPLKSRESIISELSMDSGVLETVQNQKAAHSSSSSDEMSPKWMIPVDNNLKLLLMLQVFEEEEEKFCNMFSTSIGHTEGDLEPVLVLVTTRGLYLLSCCGNNQNGSPNTTKFQKHTTVKYRELDYISLSINYQILNIVCVNRRKQVWITTGNEQLTRKLVQTIDTAIRESEVDFPRLSVLTDATTQKIGMRKWVARERGVQAGDVCILCYSLVHWEDAQSVRRGTLHIHTTKQGTLLYRAYTSYFMGSVWKPAHFALKNGVLYQYETANSDAPPTACFPLNCEQCSGCRRVPHSERNHCIEVLLSDSTSLQLAASSEAESLEWLQCLCQAVAQGMQETGGASGCLQCCLVLTSSLLLTCHEDLLTNFFRRLGSVKVVDVIRVLIDPVSPCYCLLALEAKDGRPDTDYWVLYFNAVTERDRFISALDHAWKQHFQVSLPTQLIYDIELQKRCREGVLKIQQQGHMTL